MKRVKASHFGKCRGRGWIRTLPPGTVLWSAVAERSGDTPLERTRLTNRPAASCAPKRRRRSALPAHSRERGLGAVPQDAPDARAPRKCGNVLGTWRVNPG